MRKNVFSVIFSVVTLLGFSIISNFANAKPLPIDYWAIRDVVVAGAVSPDGKHVLVMKTESKEGNYFIEVYSTDDFSKPVRKIDADPMEFFAGSPPRWVSDKVIVGGAWKFVRKKVRGPEDTAWDTLLFSYNIETNKFKTLENKKPKQDSRFPGASDPGFTIVNILPHSPDEILIATGNEVGAGTGVDPLAIIRPKSYYRYNVETGAKSLVLKGNQKYGNVQFDDDARPRFASGSENGQFAGYYRLPGESGWKEFGERADGDKKEDLYRMLGGFEGPVGVVHDDPGTALMIAARDSDKAALWEYDLKTKTYGRKLFSNPDADVLGIQTHSDIWGKNAGKLVAALYPGAKRERHWFDMQEKALYEQFESKVPNAHQVSITSRSRDGKTMVVTNRGPKDPGSYWLVHNGKMAKLGSQNPLVKPEDLSNVEYIRYKARDGQVVPAYVTKPKGAGPHPLVVLPHGGPHVNEVITYDEWGQFLANNGYMVLQPQYRMSVGWGKKHFDSAFGQHGLTMQDDKDDGAQYLIDKGWVDKDRVAMFGWSYGGYAALVAASRSPNMYQCTIAGAAVADPKKVYLKRSRGPSGGKALDEWSRARGGFVGINPIDELEKVNIPILMVHGDLDARVLFFNMKDYKQEMVKTLKTKEVGSCTGGVADSQCTTTMYKTSAKGDGIVPMTSKTNTSGGKKSVYTAKNRFLTLKGADHYYVTLRYEHQKKLYTEMLNFLQNDCGPDGL